MQALAFQERPKRFIQKVRTKSEKEQALEDLFALWQATDKEISLNGTKEIGDYLLQRYEKSFSVVSIGKDNILRGVTKGMLKKLCHYRACPDNLF